MNDNPSTTFTVRVDQSVKQRLEALARSTGRSRSWLAAAAIGDYLDLNEWQVAGIHQAIASIEKYGTIAHQDVERWAKSLGSGNVLPRPQPTRP